MALSGFIQALFQKESDSDEKGIWKEQDNSTASEDDNKGSGELARWREKRVWEKMAASKTWDAMKNAWLSSSLSGKTGADDLKFSPDESLKFSKEKLPKNKTKDDNKVILKGIINIKDKMYVPCNSHSMHTKEKRFKKQKKENQLKVRYLRWKSVCTQQQ